MAQSMKLSKSAALSTCRPRESLFAARPSVRATVAPLQAVSRAISSTPYAVVSTPRSRMVSTQAAAENATADAPSAAETKFYALLANAEFFFNDVQNESMAEQLRERVRFFKEIGRDIDFWLVPEPTWLDSKYPKEAKMIRRPCVALVSSDEVWITFMKLRLDRVLRINLGAVPQEEALSVGGKVPEFKKPEKWTAPYAPYAAGWWNVFLPAGAPQ